MATGRDDRDPPAPAPPLGPASTRPARVPLSTPVTVRVPAATATASPDTLTGAASDDDGPRPAIPPRSPDRYAILGEHGRGGIGRVLRARDHELDRVVAIKELVEDHPAAEARFVREIRLTARLEHPGIVPVHDAGRWIDDGRAFYTMKLVAGAPLRDVVVAAGSLEARLALTPHVLAVAEAVAYAHSQGVIHRDLKPSNVIVGEYGETIVIDWGLAKALADAEIGGDRPGPPSGDDVTVAGSVLGTPVFMAPEQARGAAVDARADVYALGAIGYFLVTGKAPYEGSSGADVIRQVAAVSPPPLRQREPRAPVDLAAIFDKAMARDPARRYASAREMAADLRRYQTGLLVSARDYAWWEPWLRRLRRHRVASALVAALVIAAVVGGAVAFRREQHLRGSAERERSRADVQALALLEQQGRRELEMGRPGRAAVYLAEALVRAPARRPLRWLLSEALAPLSSRGRVLLGHDRDVVCAAFSPDGRRLATGSSDLTVRVWGDAGAAPLILRGHQRSLEDVAWSPDGALVASIDGQSVRLWRSADGAPVRILDGGGFRLAFAPDGARLWTGGADGAVRIWDVATGARLADVRRDDDRVSSFTFADGGRRVITTSFDGRVIEWSADGVPGRTFDDHGAGVWFSSLSPDGSLLLTGDEDGAIFVRDATTLVVRHVLRLPAASHATSGWFAADGRTIVTASADGGLRVWHATGGSVLTTVDAVAEGKQFDAARAADGRIASAALRSVTFWSPAERAPYRVFGGADHTHALYQTGALSADGRRLTVNRIVRDRPAQVVVWDTASGEVVARWDEPGQPYSMAIDRDGSRVIVADLDGTTARIHDATTGAVVAELRGHQRAIYNLALSPDERWLATASYDRTVRLWNAVDGTPVGAPIRFERRPTAVAFDPARPRLAVALEDGTVALVDREHGTTMSSFTAHPTWIQDLEFDRAGTRLVTAGRQDHTAVVWDLAGRRPPVALLGHADNLIRASFSPDGTLVATASVDDTARVWDAATGELLRTLPGADETAAWSGDGTVLYTTGVRDQAIAWSLAVDDRAAGALAADVTRWSPWKLVEGRLVLRAPVDGRAAEPSAR